SVSHHRVSCSHVSVSVLLPKAVLSPPPPSSGLPVAGRELLAEAVGDPAHERGREDHREPERPEDRVDRQTERLGEDVSATGDEVDRKSTRLNSSHVKNSYAVFCLEKKKSDSLTR